MNAVYSEKVSIGDRMDWKGFIEVTDLSWVPKGHKDLAE